MCFSDVSSAGGFRSREFRSSASRGSTFEGDKNPEDSSAIVFESGDGAHTRNIATASRAVGFML